MAKKIQYEIDIDTDDLDKAEDKFVSLKKQIKDTKLEIEQFSLAGDNIGLDKAKKKLNDLEDSFDKAKTQGKEFHDALADMPGAAGKAGNALQGVDNAFKALIANPIVAVIAGITGLFMLLYKSLKSTKEGQETLNKVQSAFASILGPILALVEKVAIPIFSKLADIFSWVGKQLSAVASWFGVTKDKINEAALSVNEAQQKINEEEKKKAEEAQKERDANAKKQQEKAKQHAEELKKIKDDELKVIFANAEEAYLKTLDAQEKELYALGKTYSKSLALANKYHKDSTLLTENYEKEKIAIKEKYAKAANDIDEEVYLKSLSEDERAIYQLGKTYNQKLAILKAQGRDTLALTEQFEKDTGAIRNKSLIEAYKVIDETAVALLDERGKKEYAAYKKYEDAKKTLVKAGITDFADIQKLLQDTLDGIKKEYHDKDLSDEAKRLNEKILLQKTIVENAIVGSRDYYSEQLKLNDLLKQKELADLQTQYDAKLLGEKKFNDEKQKITKKYAKKDDELRAQEIRKIAQQVSQTIQALGGLASALASAYDDEAKTSKVAFEKRKKLLLASAYATAAAGIINIIAAPVTLPQPLDFILKGLTAGALAIKTGVEIKRIKATTFESQSGDSGASGIGSGGLTTALPKPSFSTPSMPTISLGNSGQSQTGNLARIVGDAVTRNTSQDRPIRAYVVGNDITTEQQLDRRVRNAARLG